jgi:hypothetical protein
MKGWSRSRTVGYQSKPRELGIERGEGRGIQCKLWAEGRYSLINIRGNTSFLQDIEENLGVTASL